MNAKLASEQSRAIGPNAFEIIDGSLEIGVHGSEFKIIP
jgi:hypothetical protein